MRLLAPVALTVLVAGVAAGCNGGGATPEVSDPGLPYSPFRTMVDQAIATAREASSEAQIAILERAKEEDEVSFELVVEAVNNAFVCMEGVDAFGTWLEPDTSNGFPVPAYKYGTALGRDEAEWLPVAEDCLKRESSIAEWLYQTQPKAIEFETAYFNNVRRPVIVECLTANGVEVPANAKRAEIELMVEDLYNESSGMVWVDNGDGSKSGYPATPDSAVQCDWDTR